MQYMVAVVDPSSYVVVALARADNSSRAHHRYRNDYYSVAVVEVPRDIVALGHYRTVSSTVPFHDLFPFVFPSRGVLLLRACVLHASFLPLRLFCGGALRLRVGGGGGRFRRRVPIGSGGRWVGGGRMIEWGCWGWRWRVDGCGEGGGRYWGEGLRWEGGGENYCCCCCGGGEVR